MGKPAVRAGGGLRAVLYVFKKAFEAGGLLRFWRRMRSKNACKTCALGMGGQQGGMTNEAGHFPEVCKKSVQAQAGDMQPPIPESFFKITPISVLEKLTSREFENLGRLSFPILAEEGQKFFRRISWEEAFSRAAESFKSTVPGEAFFYSSGRASNEAAFLLQLVARAWGTPNIHNCSYYCHQASGVALADIYGSGTASVGLEDLSKADLVLLAGANPASNHPRLITQLVNLRRRGGKVIVINPLRELGLIKFRVPSDWRSFLFSSKVSDLYLQPHVGSDVALFKALLKGVIEKGAVDREFVENHAAGWKEVERDVSQASWNTLVAACGVEREQIDEAAKILAASKRGIFAWAMGLTHHANGVDNVLALGNLALARGWLGKEGSGLLPIRGHSNVQGVGSCGVSPVLKKAFAGKLEEVYGIKVPANPGQDTYSSMLAAHQGKIRSAFLLGGNLFSSNPDRPWASAALKRIGLTLSVTTKLNEGHVHGRGRTAIIVPCLARDEERQLTTQESMFNFVRVSDGREEAPSGECRSEVEIIAELAERILPAGKFDWKKMKSHAALREEIAKVVPGFEAIRKVDGEKTEFEIKGRVLHTPRFATEGGKARFHVTPLPTFSPPPDEFRLMTLRSEGQFNTVVYEEEDLYRGPKRRDVVLMSAEDAQRLGVAEGSRVSVETDSGKMAAYVFVTGIRPGNLAMYYPEANVLVPRKLDARSKTPAFKSIAARVYPEREGRMERPLAAAAG
ncbi:MAG: FdhF/YdeP family oxidoreductase [Bdellovibrionota bacterium]